jgi:hypothetical protein
MFNNSQMKTSEMGKSVPQSSLGYAVDLNRNPYMHPDNIDIMGYSPNMVRQHTERIKKRHKLEEKPIHPGANDLKTLRPDMMSQGGIFSSANISHSGFSQAYNIHPQAPHSKNMLLKKAGRKTLMQERKTIGDPLMGGYMY